MNNSLKVLAVVRFLGLIPSVTGGLLGMNVAGKSLAGHARAGHIRRGDGDGDRPVRLCRERVAEVRCRKPALT